MFNQAHGRPPDLMRPRTYCDLIQRRKLFEWDPIYTIFSDKIAVRDYVRSMVGDDVLIPLQWVGEDPCLLPFAALSYPVIIKPNHLSGWVKVLREAPEPADADAITRQAQEWLSGRHGRLNVEPGYYKVPPRILVEDLLVSDHGGEPTEYKVFVFRGRGVFVGVSVDRQTNLRTAYYDRDWNRLPFSHPPAPEPTDELPRPALLERVFEIAETLADGSDFLRIDLYVCKEQIFFGEITLYPSSGLRAFHPEPWDRIIGDLWSGRRPVTESLAGIEVEGRPATSRPI